MSPTTWVSGELGDSKTPPPSDPRNASMVPSHGPKVGGLTLTGALRQQVDLSDPQTKNPNPTGSYRIHAWLHGLFTYDSKNIPVR